MDLCEKCFKSSFNLESLRNFNSDEWLYAWASITCTCFLCEKLHTGSYYIKPGLQKVVMKEKRNKRVNDLLV